MRWRSVIRVTATVLTALVVSVAVGAVGIARSTGEIYTPRDATGPPVSVDAAAIPAHDPTKPTAVVVLSSAGTNVADALPPYEVLASTGAFNLYTVAEQRQPMPLTGGVDLIPDLTFGQLADRLQAVPDVIVVPEIHDRASLAPPRSRSGCSGSAGWAIRSWSASVSAPKCWLMLGCSTAGPRPRIGWG
jgi:hypothetical protein